MAALQRDSTAVPAEAPDTTEAEEAPKDKPLAEAPEAEAPDT
jgi:hypothetical protein